MIFKNLLNRSGIGLIIDWHFHLQNKWFSAFTPFLVEAIVKEFNPIIISSQRDYNYFKRRLKRIISLELGVPKIRIDTHLKCLKILFHSDPHYKVFERNEYFYKNEFDFVLSFYQHPFFYHNPDFPVGKFIHFPWAVPDQFIFKGVLTVKNTGINIFGGQSSEAYDVRNWCRKQTGIQCYNNSGVENKSMTDSGYYNWLTDFDAVVAAGSSDPQFDLVTPKYFEIAASGCLLFGQDCKDLAILGFSDKNTLIFTKENFIRKVQEYYETPESYLEIRNAGRNLILERHCLSQRISLLKQLLYE